MTDSDDLRIAYVAERVGPPPRDFRALLAAHDFSPPGWLTPEDHISYIYANRDRILRDGVARWACVVHANNQLFQPGDSLSGAQVVYAPAGDVSLTVLKRIARRLFSLKNTSPADPHERRLADMLTDEMERALNWPLPASISEGYQIITTIVMMPRDQMPRGFLALTYFPIWVDRKTCLSMLIPHDYWPDDVRSKWEKEAATVQAALPPAAIRAKGVRLTQSAIQAMMNVAAADGVSGWYIRVAVVPDGKSHFRYAIDITVEDPTDDDEQYQCGPIVVLVDKRSDYLLGGVEIDFVTNRQGSGFTFNKLTG